MREGIYNFEEYWPQVHETVFIAPGAKLVGRVKIGEYSSIWFNVVVRGDIDDVKIGANTNIQDGSVLHEDEGFPLIIGDRVTVGHNAILHGCTVGDDALIGMGAVVLSGAKIGEGAVVAAGSLVVQGSEIPAGHLAVGSPAKVIRKISDEQLQTFKATAEIYSKRAQQYKKNLRAPK